MHREIRAIGGIAQIFAELLFVAIRASESGLDYYHWHAGQRASLLSKAYE